MGAGDGLFYGAGQKRLVDLREGSTRKLINRDDLLLGLRAVFIHKNSTCPSNKIRGYAGDRVIQIIAVMFDAPDNHNVLLPASYKQFAVT